MLSESFTGQHHLGELQSANLKSLEERDLVDQNTYRVAGAVGPDGFDPNLNFEEAFLLPYYRSVGFFDAPPITYCMMRAAGWPVYANRTEIELIAEVVRTSDLLDDDAYRSRVRLPINLDPIFHYILVGESLGFQPSERFDPIYYGERYRDIADAPICRLWHYAFHGRGEGRRPVSIAADLSYPSFRSDLRETILIISHEASRTGAPILAYNIALHLRQRYNIVALLLKGGELVADFKKKCNFVIGPIPRDQWSAVEADYIVKHLLASSPVTFAIANSIESRSFVPALARAFVPVLSLVHEFASYTRPHRAMGEALDWSTQIIFSTEMTANSAIAEHPSLSNRKIHILPQGQCIVPSGPAAIAGDDTKLLREIICPNAPERPLVVLGAGFVHFRKGIDLFLSCAAEVARARSNRPIHFVWIGHGYDPETDKDYSSYLEEQIERSALGEMVSIIDPVHDMERIYDMADIFFLSSRLDPLPNVTIDAAFRGLPIVCFENASGIAELLSTDAALQSCVAPYLDVAAAARKIVEFGNDDGLRVRIGKRMCEFARTTFDFDRYVDRIDQLGRDAVTAMSQRTEDLNTIRNDPLFDENFYLSVSSTVSTREGAIRDFLCRWPAIGLSRKAAVNANFRRPCVGFHPQIYAAERSSCDSTIENPLAHYIRSGKPAGPWQHDVIIANDESRGAINAPTGVHGHFFYPELISDFLHKLNCNRSRCDLLLTTDTKSKATALRRATADYAQGDVVVRVVPNRGRDIGALLSGFADFLDQYEVIGHFHSKRSPFDPDLGERWREFLWQHLLGDVYPMMDVILDRFAADETLGLVFAEDPNLSDWDDNLESANHLAMRMGIQLPLPAFFDFPNGAMFWCRPSALKPMMDAHFDWQDYPEEPLPYDGTVVHALERLVPFVAKKAGFRFSTTYVAGLTR